MSCTTGKNHYKGLLAQWYDILLENEHKDIAYYKPILLESKGDGLELGCGTGRLLIPFLQAGIDIDGLDNSEDMLAICMEKLKRTNLKTQLFKQNFAGFKIPKQYNTIFISGGSFQILENIDLAMSSLRCIHSHLKPGGRLVLDLFPLLSDVQSNQDGVWKLGRTASNDRGETFQCQNCTEMDFRNQIQRGHYKYEIYRNGHLIETIIDDLNLRWYGQQEFKMMLERAGFTKISMETVSLMSTHGESIVYQAFKGN